MELTSGGGFALLQRNELDGIKFIHVCAKAQHAYFTIFFCPRQTPEFFTRIEHKRLIVPCCSRTCCACGFTLALELAFAFALVGLIINFIVEVPVIPTGAVFTSGQPKNYVERNFTTETQLQFNVPVRLRSATLGPAKSYVKFSIFPDPTVDLNSVSKE